MGGAVGLVVGDGCEKQARKMRCHSITFCMSDSGCSSLLVKRKAQASEAAR